MNRRHFLSLVGTTTALGALGEPLHATPRSSALPQDERFWEVVRQQFPHPENVIYLNNGSLGISPRPVVDRMIRHLHDTESFEDREFNTYPWWGYANTTLNMRTKIAAFVGADPDEIALTRNATEGMNTVGSGLELEAGDEVLLSDQEASGRAQSVVAAREALRYSSALFQDTGTSGESGTRSCRPSRMKSLLARKSSASATSRRQRGACCRFVRYPAWRATAASSA